MQPSKQAFEITIVDNNPANLNFFTHCLKSPDFKLFTFNSICESLHHFNTTTSDLVLISINIPNENSFEFCAYLKKRYYQQNVSIILTGDFSNQDDKYYAYANGANDILTEPLIKEELISRVESVLATKKLDRLEGEIKQRLDTEKKYYTQLESFSDAIIHVSTLGNIVYANKATERYFEYTVHELVGLSINILIPEQFHYKHDQYFKDYISCYKAGAMASARKLLAVKKSGKTFPVKIKLSTLYSDDELLVSAEIRDISEKLELEQKIASQRQLFNDAFMNTSDGIILTNLNGDISLTNPALLTMLGYETNELSGKNISLLQDSGNEPIDTPSTSDKKKATSKLRTVLIQYKKKNNTLLPTEASVVTIYDERGKANGLFYIIRDISQRLQVEHENAKLFRQLLQSQKMESLGHLTGGVAHDFNNILASIVGFTDLSLDLIDDIDNLEAFNSYDKLRDYLNEVQIASQRAKDLIRKMLTFSRSSTSDEFQKSNMAELIDEAIKLLRPVLPASIDIKTHIHSEAAKAFVDPVQIHQLLLNFCINARDAMQDKGKINIYLNQTNVQNRLCSSCLKHISGDFLELSIQDTGPGIDTDIIKILFEPFFSTKKVGQGTGMGLAIVHSIIHRHHGHIIVESVVGKGSNFRILLPLAQAEQQKKSETSQDIISEI